MQPLLLSPESHQISVVFPEQTLNSQVEVPVGRLAVLRSTGKTDLVRAIAVLTWPALIAPVLAPALGGAIATTGSWRWIFIVNIPLGAIGFLLALRMIRGAPATERWSLDWPGMLLLGGGIATALIALEKIRLHGTNWAVVAAGAIAAAALLAAAVTMMIFGAIETYHHITLILAPGDKDIVNREVFLASTKLIDLVLLASDVLACLADEETVRLEKLADNGLVDSGHLGWVL